MIIECQMKSVKARIINEKSHSGKAILFLFNVLVSFSFLFFLFSLYHVEVPSLFLPFRVYINNTRNSSRENSVSMLTVAASSCFFGDDDDDALRAASYFVVLL